MAEAAIKEPATIVKLPSRGTLQISMARLDLAEYKRSAWRAFPEEGTKYETVLTEAYWAHRAKDFKPGDKIEVIPDEMSYYSELLVIAAGQNWAKVIELPGYPLALESAHTTAASDEYTVEWKGPHRKHAVIRVKDKAIIADGFAQKADAIAAIPAKR